MMKKVLPYILCVIMGIGSIVGTYKFMDTLVIGVRPFNNQILSVLDSCGVITNGSGHGSVVAIEPNILLTAGHCIDNIGNWIEIQGVSYEIVYEWASEDYDVGFVQIKGVLPYVELGPIPFLLDEVYLVGASRDLAFVNTITKGQICKLDLLYSDSVVDWTGNFICDAMAWYGSSGGPVLNTKGQIVGIYVGLYADVDNFSVCVPVTAIRAALVEFTEVSK